MQTFIIDLSVGTNGSLPYSREEGAGIDMTRSIMVPVSRGHSIVKRHGEIFELDGLEESYLKNLIAQQKITGVKPYVQTNNNINLDDWTGLLVNDWLNLPST